MVIVAGISGLSRKGLPVLQLGAIGRLSIFQLVVAAVVLMVLVVAFGLTRELQHQGKIY